MFELLNHVHNVCLQAAVIEAVLSLKQIASKPAQGLQNRVICSLQLVLVFVKATLKLILVRHV